MTIEELIQRHRLPSQDPPPAARGDKSMAKAAAPPLLRSKHYFSSTARHPKRQHLQQRPSLARTPWLQPEDRSEADKPLGSGNPASTKFTDIVRAATAEVLSHGEALGGDPQVDGERWVNEYLDAHHLLQADFLCEVYARAIRAIVQERTSG